MRLPTCLTEISLRKPVSGRKKKTKYPNRRVRSKSRLLNIISYFVHSFGHCVCYNIFFLYKKARIAFMSTGNKNNKNCIKAYQTKSRGTHYFSGIDLLYVSFIIITYNYNVSVYTVCLFSSTSHLNNMRIAY